MRQYYLKFCVSGMLLFWISLVHVPVIAAQAVDLRHQPTSLLKSFSSQHVAIKKSSEDKDFNQATHIRLQQTYAGYPVWGGEAILHVSKTATETMNGVFYQNLEADLAGVPSYMFGEIQADKALQQAIQRHQKKFGKQEKLSATTSALIIYIGDKQTAHWAFLTSFLAQPLHGQPEKPMYIVDALNFNIYQQWNNIQTFSEEVGGGFGGNEKTGKIIYENNPGNNSKLNIERDANSKICYLKNSEVTVKSVKHKQEPVFFACPAKLLDHDNIYWDGDQDAVNGAYSPANDALYIGKVVKDMYQNWYGTAVLTDKGKPMMLTMLVHEDMENAYWDGKEMVFGDGGHDFYPLVSLGVGAHEIAHGFTQQHSNLKYYDQSGGLNESFSDMAAKAAEFYATGHNSWEMGSEVLKAKGQALRYMDEPTKDCLRGDKPGENCSISNVKDYSPDVDVHYLSGIFNKAFYLLSSTPGWNTQKAFDIMVQANSHYWTSRENYISAACGVLDAAKDYAYDLEAVIKAIAGVGIKINRC